MKIRLAGRFGTAFSSGFSLVEVLVATALMGIGAAALHNGLLMGSAMVQNSRENLRANQILVEKMETIRLYTFDQIITPGFIPSTFTAPYEPSGITGSRSSGFSYSGVTTITNAPSTASYADSLRLVVVRVNWTSSGVSHSREMRTLVSRNGLQSYIY